MSPQKPLDEYETKVLRAIEPGFDFMIAVIPSHAGVNEFAAGAALAELKKRKLVAFEGRGRFKTVYLTDEGKVAREALS
jgi:hypothetical protein